MRRNKKIQGLQLLLLALLLLWQGTAAWATDPQAAMQETVENVLEILTDPALAGDAHWQERRERVSQEVAKRFNFTKMAQSALARAWHDRSAAEKEEFVTLFKELLKDAYVDRLKTYSDGNYKVIFDKVLVRGTRAVVSSLVIQQEQEISAAYKMYQEGDDWFVYDVVVEGVSLVSNYRSQFGSIIQKDGYEELVRRLEKKLAEPRNSENPNGELS